MAGRRRHRSPSKLWIPLLLMGIFLFQASPNYANTPCKFCRCYFDIKIDCAGVFWKGERLKHSLKDRALCNLNLEIPPTQITRDFFKGFESITKLDLSQNGKPVLDESFFMNFTSLERLYLQKNHLVDCPSFQGLESLTLLQLEQNALRDTPKDLRWTTPDLRELNFRSNRLKAVSGIHLPQTLIIINLSENLISDIDSNSFKGLVYLEKVILNSNRIIKIDDQALLLPALNEVSLLSNAISYIQPGSISPSLSKLYLGTDQSLDLADFEGLPALIGLSLAPTKRNKILNDKFPVLENLTRLHVSRVCSTELIYRILIQCPSLIRLSATKGTLRSIKLTSHSHIEDLELSFNSVEEIRNLSTVSTLVNLRLNNNLLTSVPDLFHLTHLKSLELQTNMITTISASAFNNLPVLELLVVSYNKITSVTGEFRLVNLMRIDLSDNLIQNLDKAVFVGSYNIREMHVDGNRLTDGVKLMENSALSELRLNYNKLSMVSSDNFRGLYNLNILLLHNNKISHIFSFTYLPKLSLLRLDNNPVSYIANDAFLLTPYIMSLSLRNTGIVSLPPSIGTLRFMHRVSLNQNFLTRLPGEILGELPNLQSIDLGNNNIDTIDRNDLIELKYARHLYITGNPVRTFDVGNAYPANLEVLHFGSKYTDHLSESMLAFIQQIPRIELIGSPLLRLTNNAFCNPTQRTIILTGFMIDNVNGTCHMSSTLYTRLKDVLLAAPVLELFLSHSNSASFFNVSLFQGHSLQERTICANLLHLDFVYSGILEIPVLFAPELKVINMTQNCLTSLRLGNLYNNFPSLRDLHLPYNRIRVLSSCGVHDIPHPLTSLDLSNNDLGRFSSWACGNNFHNFLDFEELNLSGNNLSFLSNELIPSDLIEKDLNDPDAVTVVAGDNPLVCSCQQRWLLDANTIVVEGLCSAPPSHAGRDLQELTREGFPCGPSMYHGSALCTVTQSATVLVLCPVQSSPPPQITWFLQDAEELMALKVMSGSFLESENEEEEGDAHRIELEIDNEPVDESESDLILICQAVNDYGQMDVVIDVHVLHDVNGTKGNQNITADCSTHQLHDQGLQGQRETNSPHLGISDGSGALETWTDHTPEKGGSCSQRQYLPFITLLLITFCVITLQIAC